MSRKLLIGSTEYAWPNDGDLNWGQDVFDWAEAITAAVNTGGGGGGTSFTVGTGLTLSNTNVLSISEAGVTLDKLAAGTGTNQILVFNGTKWVLGANPDAVRYTAGDGISLVSNEFFIAGGAITPEQLNFDAEPTAEKYVVINSDSEFGLADAPSGGSSGVPDLSGVTGGSGITVTHTDANQKASIAVASSLQSELVPRGGATGQVLTKQSGTDNDVHWTAVGTQEITDIQSGTLNIVFATHQGHLIDCKNGGNRDITLALPANSTVGTNNLTHIIDIFIRQGGSTAGNVNITASTGELQGVNPYIPITYTDNDLYIGNSTATAGGVLVSVYSRAGSYIISGAIRNTETETLSVGTTYTAGQGLALSSANQFRIENLQVTNSMLASQSINQRTLSATNANDPTPGQYLTAASSGRFTWVDAPSGGGGGTTYTAGDGLTLVSNEFSITDRGVSPLKLNINNPNDNVNRVLARNAFASGEFIYTKIREQYIDPNAITYPLLSKSIRDYTFQAPLQHSSADISVNDLDEVQVVPISEILIAIIPRALGANGNDITYVGLDGRTTTTASFEDSASSSQYGVTYNKTTQRLYRPAISGTTVTGLLAYDTDGNRESGDDITISIAIPNINTIRTSLTYNEYANAYYFLSNTIIYKIAPDGTRDNILSSGSAFADGTIIESMNNYLCEYNLSYDGGEQTYTLHQLSQNGDYFRRKAPFKLGRPQDINNDNYNHFQLLKVGIEFVSMVQYSKQGSAPFKFSKFVALNGCFDLDLYDLPTTTPDKLRATNTPNAFETSIPSVIPGTNIFRWSPVADLIGFDSLRPFQFNTQVSPTSGQVPSVSTDGQSFVWVDQGSGGGSIADDSIVPAKLTSLGGLTPKNFDIPTFTAGAFFWRSIDDLMVAALSPGRITYEKLERAFLWADNAGSIDKEYGFENMALVYKTSTSTGSNNAEWVPTDLDTLFRLESSQEGSGQDARHNYGLRFNPGAIQHEDINPIDDLEQLIGVDFVRDPATVANGNPLRSRLATPWYAGGLLNIDNSAAFPLDSTEVKFTIPRKRTTITRGITHILVKAGRLPGVTDASSRAAVLNELKDDNTIYHEITIPATATYVVNNNTIARRDGYQRYNVLFASGISCAIEVRSNLNGTTDILAESNSGAATGFNGDEFLAFYAIRGIGG